MTEVRNVTCTLCGCLCDDLTIKLRDGAVVETSRACPPARAWYLRQSLTSTPLAATIAGRPVSLEEGLQEATRILGGAAYPLVYGLGRTNCEAQRQAVHLAEILGAALDTHTSLAHGSTKLAGQLVGKITCTLGEVRNRADLVVYWGANPLVTHPRHATRYAVFPPGRYLADGGRARTVVLVGPERCASVKIADQFLETPPGADFETITALRTLVRGGRVDWRRLDETGVSSAGVRELFERLRTARYGVFFFGNGLTRSRGVHINVASLLALARDLNGGRRFVAMPLRNLGNEAGADNVLSWLSGYPFSVDYSRGYPRYNPGEFSAAGLLERGDNDAALVVAADPATSLPSAAVEHLRRIPVVLLDPQVSATSALARVQIFTAPTGLQVGGTAYRMDKVPLPLKPLAPPTAPSDEEVLRRMGQMLQKT